MEQIKDIAIILAGFSITILIACIGISILYDEISYWIKEKGFFKSKPKNTLVITKPKTKRTRTN